MLGDIGAFSVFKDTIDKAKEVAVFIYRHSWVLDLFRKCTKKKELTRPAVTRFATTYLTLKSFHERKRGLRAMCTSEEWATSIYTCTTQAKKVEAILLYDNKFWKAIQYCIKCVLPLVKVLRLVDGDARPPMGYIYEAMDRAKEEIAKNIN